MKSEFRSAAELPPSSVPGPLIQKMQKGLVIELSDRDRVALDDLKSTHELGDTYTEIILKLIRDAHDKMEAGDIW